MIKKESKCPECGEEKDSRFIGIFCDTCGWHKNQITNEDK